MLYGQVMHESVLSCRNHHHTFHDALVFQRDRLDNDADVGVRQITLHRVYHFALDLLDAGERQGARNLNADLAEILRADTAYPYQRDLYDAADIVGGLRNQL